MTVEYMVRKLDPFTTPGYCWTRGGMREAGWVAWGYFESRHKGHRFLRETAIYSLTDTIVDLIVSQIRDFFTPEDLAFERDLILTAPIGFFANSPIGGQANWQNMTREELRRYQKQANIDARNEELRELTELGATPGEARKVCDRYIELSTLMRARTESYFGWLITQAEFWRNVQILRYADKYVDERGFPPSIQYFPEVKALRPGPENTPENTLVRSFHAVYAKWCLDTMLTWEMPRPLVPLVASSDDLPCLLEFAEGRLLSGPSLFAPWYLLREEALRVSEMLWMVKFTPPKHLADWFAMAKQRNKSVSVGLARFQTAAYVYLHLFLALLRRYPEKCAGNLRQLDTVLAKAIGKEHKRPMGDQSIRKIRSALKHALKAANAPALGGEPEASVD